VDCAQFGVQKLGMRRGMCAVWCVETGDASWNMEVTYSAYKDM
jgi:hypothetical protein